MAKKKKKADRPSRGRSSPTAPKQGSPALVVTVVISMLLSIVMGVLLYMDKAKLTELENAKTTAEADKNKVDQDLQESNNYLKDKLASWVDPAALTTEGVTTIKQFESSFGQKVQSGRFALMGTWWDEFRKKVEGDPQAGSDLGKNALIGPYDPEQGKPARTLEGYIRELENQLASAKSQLDQSTRDLTELRKDFEEYRANNNDDTRRAAVVAAVNEQIEKQKRDTAQLVETIKYFETKMEGLNTRHFEELTKRDQQISQTEQEFEQKLDQEKENFAQKRKELQARYEGREIIEFDKPRGKLLRTSGDNLVVIDIGSKKQARPQLTFSVYGQGAGGEAVGDPKAFVELVTVTGANTSLARITRMARPEEFRVRQLDGKSAGPEDPEFWYTDSKDFWKSPEPLFEGDLLFNPAWDPDRSVTVTLAGIFDLDNDGQDDIDTFRKVLESMGAKVNAYLDTRDATLKGAMDYETDYLVLGELPQVHEDGLDIGIPNATLNLLDTATRSLQKEAEQKGIAIINLKRFLARIGYSTDRVPSTSGGRRRYGR